MTKILNATYSDNKLIFNQRLDSGLEGKKLEIVILKPAQVEDGEADRAAKIKR